MLVRATAMVSEGGDERTLADVRVASRRAVESAADHAAARQRQTPPALPRGRHHRCHSHLLTLGIAFCAFFEFHAVQDFEAQPQRGCFVSSSQGGGYFHLPRRRRVILHAGKKKNAEPALLERRREAAAKREEALRKAEEVRKQREREAAESSVEPAASSEDDEAVEEAEDEAVQQEEETARVVEQEAAGEEIEPVATPAALDAALEPAGGTVTIDSTMTVAQLKDMLRERALPVSGKKSELIARLLEASNGASEDEASVGSSEEEEEDSSEVLPGDEDGSEEADFAGAASEEEDVSDNLSDLTIPELKERLRALGLPLGGNKAVLVERLQDAGGEAGEQRSSATGDDREADFAGLTIPVLKERLRERGLPMTGKKADLVARLKAATTVAAFDAGDRVRARSSSDGLWYYATVEMDNKDGTFTVSLEGSPSRLTCETSEMRKLKPGYPLSDLTIGQQLTGKVTNILPFGAFVDVGADRDGLVPVSKMSSAEVLVQDVSLLVEKDQEVEVWVSNLREGVDLELSMVESKVRRSIDVRVQTMAEVDQLQVGQKFAGTVTKCVSVGVFINIGIRREGLLPKFRMPRNDQGETEPMEVGQEVDVWVRRVYPEEGVFEVSLSEDAEGEAGETGEASTKRTKPSPADLKISKGQKFDGVVENIVEYGAFVEIQDGVRGLLPTAKMCTEDGDAVEDPEGFLEIGQAVPVWVSSVAHENIELSMLPPKGALEKGFAVSDLTVGEKYEGTVMDVLDYGVFLDIGAERTGLVRGATLAESVQPGDGLEVWVSGVSETHGSFELTAIDPESIAEREPVLMDELRGGQKFSAIVKRIYSNFVLVDIGAVTPAILPVEYIDKSRITEAGYIACQIGEEIEVWVRQVKNKPSGIDRVEVTMTESAAHVEPPNLSAFMGLDSDCWLTGEVVSTEDYGLFVSVAPPSSDKAEVGMVHVTKMDGFVSDIRATFKVGEEVKVRVLNVDEDLKRVELTMKATD
eukprot:TRINITY_DN26460_c0_g1_i1.p1 TRINITY_DN26460_c0_g1~~TRINITY_DN26460_c0_g1_i1.p1  ORF type:complete len:984 (+),score=206.29 TRINITY_DN26460_c0_g1_i1:233-3184(+)